MSIVTGLSTRDGGPWRGSIQNQTGKNFLQAPPTSHHEGSLPDKPKPRLERAQNVVTKDRAGQKSASGNGRLENVPFTVVQYRQ